jgi:DNA topoisomerase-1
MAKDVSIAKIFEKTKDKRAKWIRRTGKRAWSFRYFDCDGKPITDAETLERIKSLAIPPAWTEVRICPKANGNLQVVGIDAAGRVQYKYSQKFADKQKRKKFERIEKFAVALPALRRRVNQDIALKGLPKEKVLAVMIRLINELYIRVGSEKSVKLYKTYGVTTLRNRHLEINLRRGELKFNFVGKHHIRHRQVMVDEELATIMKDLKAVGGSKLFNYQTDEGKFCPVKPSDVNSYIKTATDGNFTAKDFRTWGASVVAAEEFAELGAAKNKTELRKNIVRVVKRVAERLGNTPAVCRASYIHPAVINSYEQGVTIKEFEPRRQRRIRRIEAEYSPAESALLKLLETQKN